MRPENRAIQPVALSPLRVHAKYMTKLFRTIVLYILASGQLSFLGLLSHLLQFAKTGEGCTLVRSDLLVTIVSSFCWVPAIVQLRIMRSASPFLLRYGSYQYNEAI